MSIENIKQEWDLPSGQKEPTKNQLLWTFVMLTIKEVSERFLRYERYIEEAEIEVAEQRLQLVEYIRTSLVERLDSLRKLRDRELQVEERKAYVEGSYAKDRAVTTLIRLAASIEKFKGLHGALRWFYTPWVESETQTFLRDLFTAPLSQQCFDELNIAVGLTEEYDFLSPHPIAYFDQMRPNTPNIVTLPRIEKNNPLMWPVLMHEVGHAMIQSGDIDKEFQVRIRQQISEGQCVILQEWARELGAHLLALKLLGPAYLMSYLNFYTFIFHDGKKSYRAFHEDSKDTPSALKRLEFMRYRLEKVDHRFFSEESALGFYWAMFETRLILEKEKRKYDPGPEQDEVGPQVSEHEYETLVELVTESIEREFSRLGLSEFQFDSHFSVAEELKGRLSEGELISSRRASSTAENQVLSHLEKGDLVAACKALHEEPCSPREIIGAGWLAKIRREFATYNRYYADKDAKIVPFREELDAFEYSSRLVAKSIEIARIHRNLLENSRALIDEVQHEAAR